MPVNFNRTFLPERNLRADQACKLQFHFRGVGRELVGLLEKKAAFDPEHFLFWGVDALTKQCHRYHGGAYSKRAVENALNLLRKLHILSRGLYRKRSSGVYVRDMRGFIVAAHDALFIREGNCCRFVGMGRASGAWECLPGVAGSAWWKPFSDALGANTDAAQGAVVAADAGAVQGAVQMAERCGKRCGSKETKGAVQGAEKGADDDVLKMVSAWELDDAK